MLNDSRGIPAHPGPPEEATPAGGRPGARKVVAVLDYGVGNLRNVARAVRALGQEVVVATSPAEAEVADLLILPGVGAFGQSIGELARRGFDRLVVDAVTAGRPLLGICVGFQLLFEEGLEFGRHPGLGLLGGRVAPFPPGTQVPHVGWNQVAWRDGKSAWYYFVHSFRPEGVAPEVVLGTTEYAGTFPSAVRCGAITGVQFHPEKSQQAGLAVLAEFLDQPVAAPR